MPSEWPRIAAARPICNASVTTRSHGGGRPGLHGTSEFHGISGTRSCMQGGRNGTSVGNYQRVGRHCARTAMQGFRTRASDYFGHDIRSRGGSCAWRPVGVDHLGDDDTRDGCSIRLSDGNRDTRGSRTNLRIHHRGAQSAAQLSNWAHVVWRFPGSNQRKAVTGSFQPPHPRDSIAQGLRNRRLMFSSVQLFSGRSAIFPSEWP
jgi:hypothetical protein